MFDFEPTPEAVAEFSAKNAHLTTAHACPGCNRAMSHFFSKKNKRKMLVCRHCKKMYDTKNSLKDIKQSPKPAGDVTKDFAADGLDPIHKIGNSYRINPAKWGHVPFKLTGFNETTGRATFNHPKHGNATMGLAQLNQMKPIPSYKAPAAAKTNILKPMPAATPVATPAPKPQLTFKGGKLTFSQPMAQTVAPVTNPVSTDANFAAEVVKSLTSPILPGGPTSKPIERMPANSPRIKTEITKTNKATAGDRNLRIDSGKLANHMATMMAHAQDPHSTVELPAFHDSFEAMHRHPAPMVKAAFAQAFPHLVANGNFPADGTEAASRYQREVGKHLYAKAKPSKSGEPEQQDNNRPSENDLEANLTRMRRGEKFHGRPWIQSLLKNLENSHPNTVHGIDHPEGMTPYAERLEMLKNGSLNQRNLKMLFDKMHKPYGSVTMDQFYKHVLPNMGYDPQNRDPEHGYLSYPQRRRVLASAQKDAPHDAHDLAFQEEDKKQVAKWAPMLNRGNRFVVNGITYHPRFGGRSGKEVTFVPLHERDNPNSHTAQNLSIPWNEIPEFVRRNHKGNDAMFSNEPEEFPVHSPGSQSLSHDIGSKIKGIAGHMLNPDNSPLFSAFKRAGQLWTGAGGDPLNKPKGNGKTPVAMPNRNIFWNGTKTTGEAQPISTVHAGEANKTRDDMFNHHTDLARAAIGSMGVKDLWNTNLHDSPTMRSAALKYGPHFDEKVDNAEGFLKQAGALAKQEDQPRITTKLQEISKLRNTVTQAREALAKNHYKGTPGAGSLHEQTVLKHLSEGGDKQSAVEHLMQEGKLSARTARRYVAKALTYAHKNEQRLHREGEEFLKKYVDLPVAMDPDKVPVAQWRESMPREYFQKHYGIPMASFEGTPEIDLIKGQMENHKKAIHHLEGHIVEAHKAGWYELTPSEKAFVFSAKDECKKCKHCLDDCTCDDKCPQCSAPMNGKQCSKKCGFSWRGDK